MINSKIENIPVWQQFRQRLETMPTPKTEESILLRILVQTLVIIGIIATDVASQTYISLWAVPLSIVGATWSWYRRHKRNITMKFLLAIGMMAVLVHFLSTMDFYDRRVSLAQLLIELQVLHSFDLPRRKDLGYSMVIGLILLAVAGTIAQTLAFAPWLLLFLSIALPTLILDYRSRLGLGAISLKTKNSKSPRGRSLFRQQYSPLSITRLAAFLSLTLLFGLIIFALFPRVTGYQLQNFPVSGPAELASQGFDQEHREIVNPGYTKEGKAGNEKTGLGTNQTEGSGTVDDTFYYGFNSKMNQNLRGDMKPELVMRVRSQAPGFWRVLAFDHYRGQGWEISRNNYLFSLSRSLWRYRFYAAIPDIDTPTKEVIQSYTITSTLPNLIPSLSYPEYVYFPSQEVAKDQEGSLRAPRLLSDGLTYTIISQVPYRDRTLLRSASENYPKNIEKYYLQIPDRIAEKVRLKAEELLAKSPKPLTSNYEKALFLTQALKQNYALIPDLPFFDEKEDLVEAFLFKYKGGYPDHFSTVLTVMLRSLGIPSRLVVGFAPGHFNPFTGYYLVYNTDAHAITEVYFPKYGWFSFDPIPGHPLFPPSFEEEQTFSVLKQFWNWVAGWLPPPFVGFVSFLWNNIMGTLVKILSWLWSFFSGSLMGMLIGLIFAMVLGFLGWLGWNQLITFKYRRHLAKLPPMERLYQQMLGLLKTKGYAKHPAQTPYEYVAIARNHHPPEQVDIIDEISQAYVRWRYGENPPNLPDYQQKLQFLRKIIRKKMK